MQVDVGDLTEEYNADSDCPLKSSVKASKNRTDADHPSQNLLDA